MGNGISNNCIVTEATIIDGATCTPEILESRFEEVWNRPDSDHWQRTLYNFARAWLTEQSTFNISTSGSTGLPKTIEIPREAMISSAQMTGNYFDLKSGDLALLNLPVDYVAGKMMLVRAFTLGLKLVIVPPSGNPLQDISLPKNIAFGAFTPYQVHQILNDESTLNRFQDIKKVIIGGGAVDYALRVALEAMNNEVYAVFGMTETVSHVAAKKMSGVNQNDLYHPVSDQINFTIDDRSCLVINAPMFSKVPLFTNDVVELQQGGFAWRGRIDHVVNSGGIKLFPESIEEKLRPLIQSPLILAGVTDAELGQRLIMVIEGKAESYDRSDLQVIFRRVLSRYEIPKAVYFAEQFSYTGTDKVDRRQTLNSLGLS